MPAPLPAPGPALNWHTRWRAIHWAVLQRLIAAGPWDRGFFDSHGWTGGTVPAGVTETGFTDPTKSGVWDPAFDNPWDGVNEDDVPEISIPTGDWRIVFEHATPELVVVARLTNWDAAGALEYENVRDYVTSGQIGAIADLEGRTYRIINGRYGLDYSERFLQFPNARQYAIGRVSAATTSTITDASAVRIWRAPELVGKDLLFYATDADGRLLRRVTVTAADVATGVITFAVQAYTPEFSVISPPPFCVVVTGARAYPGRTIRSPFSAYLGAKSGYFTHTPGPNGGDYIGTAWHPATLFKLPGDDGGGTCDGHLVLAMDVDIWQSFPLDLFDVDCPGAAAEKPETPWFHQSFRAVHVNLENASTAFVENKEYEGEDRIRRINPAVMFQLAGINHYSATTATVEVSGGDTSSDVITLAAPVAFPFVPIEVYYAVKRDDDTWNFGFGLATSMTRIKAGWGALPDTFAQSLDEGKDVVISLGWTRFQKRQFKRIFRKTVFVADVVGAPPDRVDGPPHVLDFAGTGECTGIGKWRRRPASTKYLDSSQPQTELQIGKEWRDDGAGEPFVDGEYGRYVGDSFPDATIRNLAGSRIGTVDPNRFDYNRYYTGRFPGPVQQEIDAQLDGRASGGSEWYLEDESKNWYDARWYAGDGVLRIESGTADGGSNTSLSDSTKTAGEANCPWKASRFPGFDDGPYSGFTVEILLSGTDFDDPAAVIEQRFVEAGDEGAASLTWAEPLDASAAGLDYRIVEPRYELNRYEGRRVRIWKPDPATPGAALTATIVLRGNSHNRLWFATSAPWPVDATTRYQIIEPPIGGVFRWDATAGEWVDPAGEADAVRLGVTDPVPFRKDPRSNCETIVRRYGRYVPWTDVVCEKLIREIYAVLDVLRATRKDGQWTNVDADGVTHDNVHYVTPFDFEQDYGTFADMMAVRQGEWPGFADTAETPTHPQAIAWGAEVNPPFEDGYLKRVYAFAHIFDVPTHAPSVAEYYVYATVNAADNAVGSDCVPGGYWYGGSFNVWADLTFDDHGEGTLYRAYHKWYADPSANTLADRTSGQIGDISSPPNSAPTPSTPGACFDPGAGDYQKESWSGWYGHHYYAVIRWEFDDLPPLPEPGAPGGWDEWIWWEVP